MKNENFFLHSIFARKNVATRRYCVMLGVLSACFFLLGCNEGLKFNPLPAADYYALSGKITLAEPVEDDLITASSSIRTSLITVGDFSKFQISAGDSRVWASRDGSFSLSKVSFSNEMVLEAKAGKVVLRRRIFPRELLETDVSKLVVSVETTAVALIWERAHQMGKELTEWDIAAREYKPAVASVARAVRFALQVPVSGVPSTILDLDMVKKPVLEAASLIEPRESILRDAHRVIENALLKKNFDLIACYISTSFGNDWDSTASRDELLKKLHDYFSEYDITVASWTIIDMELLPESKARVRLAMQADWYRFFSDAYGDTGVFVSDVMWQREGNFWKIVRNMPYKATDPRTAGADARWGQIAAAHAQLQAALAVENLEIFRSLISRNFGNDWDLTSTWNDIIETAQARFNACDVKIATYTINAVEFIGSDLARVHCSAEVRVIRLLPGIDVDSGKINAVVDWMREDGVWKIFRNLPYRFSHPTNIK